ncbi:hypothetical protein ACIA74_45305, partial [Streptomyces sp. NPDC051658]|uniref:hypothetical protein n=1 Tax=Streptomyces sp. NPDC051658 TaxID=3365667 RepID=UPI0037ADC452
MNTTDTSRPAPGFAGTRIAPAGQTWDAIRVPRFLGLQTIGELGNRARPVTMDPAAHLMYFLVPTATASTWNLPQTTVLSARNHVVIPPQDKETPPGPYWQITSRRPLTDTAALHHALQKVQVSSPDNSLPIDLTKPTLEQARGLNRSGFDRDSFPWKDRVRYGEAISEGAQGAGR